MFSIRDDIMAKAMTENQILRKMAELKLQLSNLAYELGKTNKSNCMQYLHCDIRSIEDRIRQVAKDHNWQVNP